MVQHGLGIHHLKKRERKKLGKRSHPNRWKGLLDRMIYGAAILGPLIAIPQVFKVWMYKDASDLAFATWFTWWCLAFVWLSYGIIHKEKPIIAVNVGWIIIHTAVVIGIILY